MKPLTRALTLAAFSVFAARAAEPAQLISTVGPVELCESQALTQTFFNPKEFQIEVEVDAIQERAGRLERVGIVLQILPGSGASVVYQQGRVLLDADLNEAPDTCERPVTMTVVVKAKGDVRASPVVRVDDKSQLLSRASRVAFGAFVAQDNSRAVSEPFRLDAAGEVTARLLNIGPAAGAYTVEVADALTGLVVAAKTVYVDPGLDSGQAGLGASAEFTFHDEGAGSRVAFIKRVSPDASDPAAAVESALTLSFQADAAAGGAGIITEQITIAHEGFGRY